MAEWMVKQQRHQSALEVLEKIQAGNLAYIPEIIPTMLLCQEQLGRSEAELFGWLQSLYELTGAADVAICLAHKISLTEDAAACIHFLQNVAKKNPSIKVLHLLVAQLMVISAPPQQDALNTLRCALEQMLDHQARYRCEQCGLSGMELHWRCPSCRHWESTLPVG
jgi:lipopolysaccharide biosynthesis regulator YciM